MGFTGCWTLHQTCWLTHQRDALSALSYDGRDWLAAPEPQSHNHGHNPVSKSTFHQVGVSESTVPDRVAHERF